jgi:hypothetical protein
MSGIETATDPTLAYRLGVKFFVTDPQAVKVEEFIPVFHRWIQTNLIEDHLLIDVADYAHVPDGPGVLLIAHQANFGMDLNAGLPGLYYYRKRPEAGSFEERLKATIDNARNICSLIMNEEQFAGKIVFDPNRLLVRVNDRLLAPNDAATFELLHPRISRAVESALGVKPAQVEHHADPGISFEVEARLK